MPVKEHDFEPIRGLPERLPEGEHILWQGAPVGGALARYAFHTRKFLLYFGILLIIVGISAYLRNGSFNEALLAPISWLPLAALGLGILYLFGWTFARTTVYTVTTDHVVCRIGVALPITITLPLRLVESAALKVYPDGTGDIPLSLKPNNRVNYWLLWPHARPWRMGKPEPMLRNIPEPQRVAELLSEALRDATERAAQEDEGEEGTDSDRPPSPHAAAESEPAARTAAASA